MLRPEPLLCDDILLLVESESALLTTKASSSGIHRGHGNAEEIVVSDKRTAVACEAFMIAGFLGLLDE